MNSAISNSNLPADSTFRIYDPDKPLISIHIPKCAGSSIPHALYFWFRGVYRHLWVDESKEEKFPKIDVIAEDGSYRTDIKCFHGHFDNARGYGLPDYCPEVDQYISIFRDPFDIVVSMYFFFKGKSASGEFFHDGKQIDIRDQYPTVEHYIRTRQDWLFDHLPQNIQESTLVEDIRRQFVYIGLFEDLQLSVDIMAKMFGKKSIELPVVNASQYDEPVPERLRDHFYREFPFLVKIYEFVKTSYRDPINDLNLDMSTIQRISLKK